MFSRITTRSKSLLPQLHHHVIHVEDHSMALLFHSPQRLITTTTSTPTSTTTAQDDDPIVFPCDKQGNRVPNKLLTKEQRSIARLGNRYSKLPMASFVHFDPHKQVVSMVAKVADESHPVFKAHFPDQPVLPGVYQMELMTQAAAVLIDSQLELLGNVKSVDERNHAIRVVLDHIAKLQFRSPILPNQSLHITAEFLEDCSDQSSDDGNDETSPVESATPILKRKLTAQGVHEIMNTNASKSIPSVLVEITEPTHQTLYSTQQIRGKLDFLNTEKQ
eukprot:TRINITY_DN1369_c0_g1_i10.p1 TRINITY_DN1369_c0_g1~~TRINITY_DN1369_c0_g1_i10.p1  ORF type:complete len:276 (-),score=53.37 TRINITY_DN1369_c0_g1_i10:13-840(-)